MAVHRLCYLTTLLYPRAFEQMACAGLLLGLVLCRLVVYLVWDIEKVRAAFRVESMRDCVVRLILNRGNISNVFTYLRHALLDLLGAIRCDSEVCSFE